MNQKYHSLCVAMAAIVVLIMMIVGCGHKGAAQEFEVEEYKHYSDAVQLAQDSGNYQKALQLSKEFYDISQEGHSSLFQAHATSSYAQLLMVMGQPEEGKRILDELMTDYKSLSKDTVMAEIFNAYGLYEMAKGQNAFAATEYYLKALSYARQYNDKKMHVSVLTNVVTAMSNLRDTMALKYALEDYRIADATDNAVYKVYAALVVFRQMRLRNNLKEEEKWLEIFKQNAPQSRTISVNTLQSQVFMDKKDYKRADYYIDTAIAMADTSSILQPGEREDIYFIKAIMLNKQGKYEDSNRWLDKLEKLSQQTNITIQKNNVKSVYADNYEHLGNYKKALEYRNEQVEIMTDNTNSDRIKIQKAKEVALDIAQKDAEIEYHRDHAHLMEWLLWGAVAFIALLTALCLYIYNMYKRQRKLMTVVVERAQPEEVTEEQRRKQVDDRHVELFRQIKEEIDDKKMFLDANLSRESLAKHLGTNRTYISEAVAQMTGMNFPQYINLLRINEAERRLHDPQVDVSNFANFGRTLGFASLNAFRTAFKQQTGMTLSAYREIARRGPTPALPV